MENISPLKYFYLSLHITHQSWTGPVELGSVVTSITIVMNYGLAFSCLLTMKKYVKETVCSSFILTVLSFPNTHERKVKHYLKRERPTSFYRADSTVPTLWVLVLPFSLRNLQCSFASSALPLCDFYSTRHRTMHDFYHLHCH